MIRMKDSHAKKKIATFRAIFYRKVIAQEELFCKIIDISSTKVPLVLEMSVITVKACISTLTI